MALTRGPDRADRLEVPCPPGRRSRPRRGPASCDRRSNSHPRSGRDRPAAASPSCCCRPSCIEPAELNVPDLGVVQLGADTDGVLAAFGRRGSARARPRAASRCGASGRASWSRLRLNVPVAGSIDVGDLPGGAGLATVSDDEDATVPEQGRRMAAMRRAHRIGLAEGSRGRVIDLGGRQEGIDRGRPIRGERDPAGRRRSALTNLRR